jgi:hypothetical protein
VSAGDGKVTAVEGIDPERRALVGMSDLTEDEDATADVCVVQIKNN